MTEKTPQVLLQDGTLIRHKVTGYEGRIEGTTEIKTCFTEAGALLEKPTTRQTFQYRVAIQGEPMRRIAPADDLEILEGVAAVVCPRCHSSFRTKPGFGDKPGGRCQCGGWICPSCLACRDTSAESNQSPCLKQRKRFARKLAEMKKVGRSRQLA
jgi:hypothetical protein